MKAKPAVRNEVVLKVSTEIFSVLDMASIARTRNYSIFHDSMPSFPGILNNSTIRLERKPYPISQIICKIKDSRVFESIFEFRRKLC